MTQTRGWIKVHRKIENSQCWNHSIEMRSVFLTSLLHANHKRKHWQNHEIEAGEFITSLSKLAKLAKVSVSQVRTCLKHLTNWKQIRAQNLANKMTKITICNWALYQEDSQADCTVTDKPLTTNKNVKNDKQQEVPPTPSSKYHTWYQEFIKAHSACRTVPEGAFEAAVRMFEPEVDPGEAISAFCMDMAGVLHLPYPIREFKKYLRRSGSKVLEKKGAPDIEGGAYVPTWKRDPQKEW